MTDIDYHYSDSEADTSKTYWIVEEDGAVIAEVKLPNTYNKATAYTMLGSMARALNGQWTDGN